MATTYEAVTPAVSVDVGERIPPDQQDVVRRSVQTMAAYSAKEADRVRTAEAKEAEISAALNAPLAKLTTADPKAVDEFKRLLSDHHLSGIDSLEIQRPGVRLTQAEDVNLHVFNIQTQVWGPPYDFSWSWGVGKPPFSLFANRTTGEMGVDARSGAPPMLPGGADGFVEAHAGFGCFFGSPPEDFPALTGEATMRVRNSFALGAFGPGSSAVTEGGVEATILEDGQLKVFSSHRLWRKRCSFNESDHGASPGIVTDTPMRIQWPMRVGHVYTFNFGIWARTERTNTVLVNSAAAQGLIEGIKPIVMTVADISGF